MACRKGTQSSNQDDFCAHRFDDLSIVAVFDGHGPLGQEVASLMRETLPRLLLGSPVFKESAAKALYQMFPTAQEICQAELDCALSGSSATVVLLREEVFYVAHVGNSRAVLAKESASFIAQDLTRDHLVDLEPERLRVLMAGGEVRRLRGDAQYRVFLPGQLYPGLTMTRALGDTIGATIGVTSTPEVWVHPIGTDWRFLLLCSDGVWCHLSSQEAVDLVSHFPPDQVQAAAESLAAEAWARWRKVSPELVDDITAVVVNLTRSARSPVFTQSPSGPVSPVPVSPPEAASIEEVE